MVGEHGQFTSTGELAPARFIFAGLTGGITAWSPGIDRIARFDRVREFSANVELAADATEFAQRYAEFSHWMLATAPTT